MCDFWLLFKYLKFWADGIDNGNGNGGGATGIKLVGGIGGAGVIGTMRVLLLLAELFLIVTTAGGATGGVGAGANWNKLGTLRVLWFKCGCCLGGVFESVLLFAINISPLLIPGFLTGTLKKVVFCLNIDKKQKNLNEILKISLILLKL